jgi:hypothetical protein
VTISGAWDLTYKTISQLKGKSGGKITFSNGAKITIFQTSSSYGYTTCNFQGNAILEVKDHSTFLVKPFNVNSNHDGDFLNESGGTVSVAGNSRFLANGMENTGSNSTITVTDNSLFQIGTVDNSDNFTGGELKNGNVLTVTSSTFAAGIVTNSGSAAFTDSVATVGDAGNTALALNNTNQFSLTSTGERNATLTVNGDAKSTKTFTITTGAALSSVAVASSAEARTVSVVVKDSSNTTIYSNDSFSIAANAESISIYSADFIVGETYSITVAGASAGSKVATSGAHASLTVNGTVTNSNTSANRAVITVDAGSSFSADSFVNNNGRFEFVYKQNDTNISIDSFNNNGGIIQIDVTEYLDNIVAMPSTVVSGITFSASDKLGTITLVDSKGRTDELAKISYSLNANNELVLGPQPIFVNARWAEGADGHMDIPLSVTYNGRTYYLTGANTNALAFGNLQQAIEAASSGATIVFYVVPKKDGGIYDFMFYPQGLVTIDKNLFFESNVTSKAVKFDALKISTGCTAEFRTGLYSMEDFIDNDGTVKIVNHTRFNGDLIKNANGTITLDKTSHLVAASIDAGIVEVRAGFVYNDLKWIERPYDAKIGDNVTINLVYPYVEGVSPHVQDGVVYETRTIESRERLAVVETIDPGDQVYVKVDNDGNYICYGTAAHHKDNEGQPQAPSGDDWDSFYAATEYGGLQLIDDEFDLVEKLNGTYSTAAIYVNNAANLRTATLSATRTGSKTLSVTGTSLVAGGYNCTVEKDGSILPGTLIVASNGDASAKFDTNFATGTYTIVLADPKYSATASAGELTLTGTGLAAGTYRYSITTASGILTGDCDVTVVEDVNSVTIQDAGLAAGTEYTVVLTKKQADSTITVNSQDLPGSTAADHQVSVSTEFEGNPIVYDSFMGALNSVYIAGHTVGTATGESGMVIRLQGGTYKEGDFSIADKTAAGDTYTAKFLVGDPKHNKYNVIVEPDRWMDEDGQWHYDSVSMVLGGTFGEPDSVNYITFYKLKDLTIDNWAVGRDDGLKENAVINFVDIENLSITIRLKPQGGATVRILNSNVTSNRHFSVTGGKLIIENSHVKLTGHNAYGALSTENNQVGSGTVIVRNSVFELTDSSATDMVVNLKLNSEFTISGTCTVNGVFTNLNPEEGKNDTCISFRDAILDENTNIQAGENDTGAALRFEGYNVMDGSTVVQNGNQDMTIESGSTLDMSGGASITVGGGVDVSNCGNITLDNASISAGSFTNEGSLTLSDGSGINLVHDHIETGSGSNTMVVEFDDFYAGKTINITVTDENRNPVALTSNTVTPEIVDGKCKATITKADGNFLSTKNYTISHDGYFVNSDQGTLTVELQSDGSLGINTANGTPVPIDNSGTIYIDLSHADMPDYDDAAQGRFIDLKGLSGDGDVVVIGGGGVYQPVEPGASGHPARISFNMPPTRILYVNKEWSNESIYKTGSNVGSFTYFGYNAFQDNPDNDSHTVRDLEFKSDSAKVIYYGGNSYGALDLSAAGLDAPKQLTLTTMGSMSTATLTVTFTAGAAKNDDKRTVTIVVKDTSGKVVEKHNYIVAASAESQTIPNVVFYTSNLSQSVFAEGGYTIGITDNDAAVPANSSVGAWTVADLTDDRDTAAIGPMTVAANQTVTISGATMSMSDGATDSITVGDTGAMKVGTGESAILEIPVATSNAMRDVKVVVKIGSNEEYHTVQAAKDASSVTVESKSFAPGQEYSIAVTDTQQASAVGNILPVEVVEGAARTIDVVVRNAEGVKFTFTNVSVGAGATKVYLDPHEALDNTSATVSGSPEGITVTNNGGSLTLHVNGTVAAQKVDVYVQKTVGDTVYRFDYTFNVEAHSGSTETTYDVSTRFSSDGYYYVEASEPDVTATAEVSGIAGSHVKAEDVTNNGTLTVSSQEDVGRLDLTVESGPEARTAQVTVKDSYDFTIGTYDVDIAAGSISAFIVSSDILAGKTYTATVTDTLFQTGVNPAAEPGTAPKLTFALAGTAESYTVQVTDHDSGNIIGNYTARRSGDTYTVVSDEFKAETKYTVSTTIGDEEVSQVVTSSEAAGGSASQLAITVGAGAARTVTAVVKQGTTVVGTFDVAVAESDSDATYYLVSSEFTGGSDFTVSIAGENTYSATISGAAVAANPRKAAKLILDVDRNDNASRWIEVKTKPTLVLMTGQTAGRYDYSITTASGTITGTCDVDAGGKTFIKADGLVAGTEYSVALSQAEVPKGSPVSATAVDTYSLFVEKGASTAELESEDFMVGTEYADIKIMDAYSAMIKAQAGATESAAPTLTLTGLAASDNIIRPDGNLQRTLKVTVKYGATDVDTYTIADSDIDGGSVVISDSRFVAGREYTMEVSDEKTVVATAETLTVFDSTGDVVNESGKTIEITDATFNAGTITNNSTGTITLTNAMLTVGTTDAYDVFFGGTITNSGSIMMDANSLITAKSIDNSNGTPGDTSDDGTITVDAALFDPKLTDMKKVIDLEDGEGGTFNGTISIANPVSLDIGILIDKNKNDYWLVAAERSVVYVNEAWATDEYGLAHEIGDNVGTVKVKISPDESKIISLYYGYNAFSSFTEAYEETLSSQYYLNDEPQTIGKIEVYGSTAAESVKSAMLGGKAVADLTIAVHDPNPASTATAVIPFDTNADHGLTLIPADSQTITIEDGVTIQTTGSGSVYLGGNGTVSSTGTVKVYGGIDSEGAVLICGKTEVIGGTLKAASLTVTDDNLLTVSGVSTLDIGELSSDNPIRLLTGTTLQDSSVSGVAGSRIASEGAVTVNNSTISANSFTVSDYIDEGDSNNNVTGSLAFTGNNTLYGTTITATDRTVTNTGAITIHAGNSLIQADNLVNTSGTVTVDVSAYTYSGSGTDLVMVIDVDSNSDLTMANISIDPDSIPDGLNVRLVQGQDKDIYIGVIDQTTLYVNSAWAEKSGGGTYTVGEEIEGNAGKYYGINAFDAFDGITVAQGTGQTTTYTTTTTLNFAANSGSTGSEKAVYGTMNAKRYFYADQDISFTATGTNDVSIQYERLYLMHAVEYVEQSEDNWVVKLGDKTFVSNDATVFDPDTQIKGSSLPTFTIGAGLTFNMTPSEAKHGVLKVGDILDDGDSAKRTGGVANLAVAGTLNAAVYVSPYSTVTVTGLLNDTRQTEAMLGSYLRQKGVLKVEGAGSTDTTLRLRLNNLSFNDGGTLALTNTTAEIGHMRFAGVSDSLLASENAVITLDHTMLGTTDGATGNYFLHNYLYNGKYDADFEGTITLDITNGSTLDVRGTVFNPQSMTTVTLTGSELKADTITNAGTIELDMNSTLTVYGTVTNNAGASISITNSQFGVTGTIANSATATDLNPALGISMDVNSLITAAGIDNTSGTITIDATGYNGSTTGMKKIIALTADDNGALQSTDVRFTVGGVSSDAYYLIYDRTGYDYYVTDADQKLMFADSSWSTGTAYGTFVGSVTVDTKTVNLYYGYNAFSSVTQAVGASSTEVTGQKVVLKDQTVTSATYFEDVKGEVINGNFESGSGKKNLYGGRKYTGSANLSSSTSSDLTISGSDKTTDAHYTNCMYVSGGSLISMAESDQTVTLSGSATLTIDGGLFTKYVLTGADKVTKGQLVRTGDVTLNINGGIFGQNVAGGAMFSGSGSGDGSSTLENVSMTITGGTFADGTWLYGGSLANTKSNGSRNSIEGNVTITIDTRSGSSANPLKLSNVVAGSLGFGTVGGYTKVEFKGKGIVTEDEVVKKYLTFAPDDSTKEAGQIWGGCSGDSFSYESLPAETSRTVEGSKVTGDRILSFTGFEGALDCKEIGGFSKISFTDHSSVILGDSTLPYNFSEAEKWTFENGSNLEGNFVNNFNGDTLALTGLAGWSWASDADDWTILTNSSSTAFLGFDSFSSVSFGTGEGSAASYYSVSDVWYNNSYVMYRSETSMILTTYDSYVTRFGAITVAE